MNSLAKLSLLLSMSVICIAQNLSTGPLKSIKMAECKPGSVIRLLESMRSPKRDIPCDGPTNETIIWPSVTNVTIDGKVYPLEAPQIIVISKLEHGKLVASISGIISVPELCAGDSYHEEKVLVPSTPFNCSGNSYLDQLTSESLNITISGKCSSDCTGFELYYSL